MRKNIGFIIAIIIIVTTFHVCSEEPEFTSPYDSHYNPAEWAPSNFSVTGQNIHTIKLNWHQAEDNIDGFKIDKKIGNSDWKLAIATLDINTKSYTDTTAVLNEMNYYRVYAYADRNNSGYADTSIVHKFAAPTNLTATAINDESIQLTWTDNCSFETGYFIDRRKTGSSFQQVAQLGDNQQSYTDENLNYQQEYEYLVRAYTANNSDYSNIDNATTLTIDSPTNLTATAINDESIKLTWEDNCSFEQGYTVERSEEGSSFTAIADLTVNTTQYTDNDVNKNIFYEYRILSYTDRNQSDYSNEFTIALNLVKDIEGNVYQVVKIGNQYWMAENLKVTKYRNGESIQKVTDVNNETAAYYDGNNAKTYGYLYNWYAVDDSRNIAPKGWHVPTDEEWEELARYISDDNGGYSKSDDDWNNVGTHLKAISGWNLGGNGTDYYGFTGLPAGSRNFDGNFYNLGSYAFFWSASEYNSNYAWYRSLYRNSTKFYRSSIYKRYGYSIRCVRD